MQMYTDYGSYYDTTSSVATGLVGGVLVFMTLFWLIGMAMTIVMLVANYKIYKKAGKNGWEALIPIYNIVVLLEIVELPIWYIALFFVPVANVYAMFKIYTELAYKFGKDTLFGILTMLFSFVCLPILGFGKAEFQGNSNKQTNINQSNNQPMQQPVVNQPQPNVQPQPAQQPVVNSVQPTVQPQSAQQPVVNPAQPNVQSQPAQQPVVNPVQPNVQPQPAQQPVVNSVQPTVQPQSAQQPVVNPVQQNVQPQNPDQSNDL